MEIREVEQFYENQAEPNKSCLLALRGLILGLDKEMSETQKWGIPCFCLGKKILFYLSIDKKTQEPYLLVVEGRQVDHPALEMGNRKKMKILRVDPKQDLPVETIHTILHMALDLCRK